MILCGLMRFLHNGAVIRAPLEFVQGHLAKTSPARIQPGPEKFNPR
jgi:hypothetical protein